MKIWVDKFSVYKWLLHVNDYKISGLSLGVKVWVVIGGEPDIFGLVQAVDFWFCSLSVLEWLRDFALGSGSMVLWVWRNVFCLFW
jgi:hypothetical protein